MPEPRSREVTFPLARRGELLDWRRPHVVHLAEDVFAPRVYDDYALTELFGVAVLAQRHQLMLRTAHLEEARQFIGTHLCPRTCWETAQLAGGAALERFGARPLCDADARNWPPRNLSVGIECSSQAELDARMPELLRVPTHHRHLRIAPLAAAVDVAKHLTTPCPSCQGDGKSGVSDPGGQVWEPCRDCEGHGCYTVFGWVTVAGGTEPVHPDWVRGIRDACAALEIPFRFEGWGEWKPISETPEEEYDRFYYPAPARDPEGTRKCRYENRAVQYDGGDGYQVVEGRGGYLCWRLGAKRACRTLDGILYDALAEVARG